MRYLWGQNFTHIVDWNTSTTYRTAAEYVIKQHHSSIRICLQTGGFVHIELEKPHTSHYTLASRWKGKQLICIACASPIEKQIHMRAYTHALVHTRTHGCMTVHTNKYTYKCVTTRTDAYITKHTLAYTRTHAWMHNYTHTYIHVQIHIYVASIWSICPMMNLWIGMPAAKFIKWTGQVTDGYDNWPTDKHLPYGSTYTLKSLFAKRVLSKIRVSR